MTEQWQTNGMQNGQNGLQFSGLEGSASRDGTRQGGDERQQTLGLRTLTPPPKSLMIAAATIFAASAFFALRLRNRRGSSLFNRFGSPREKSLIVRGIENGGLSLIALAVQRLGTRGLDHLMATGATAEKSAEHERPGVRTDDVRRRAPV